MTMMLYASLLTLVNAIILLCLLLIYINNFKQLRASFSLGLILFASVFFIQKLVSLYLFFFVMHKYEELIGKSMFILEALSTIAFVVLLWITMR